LTLTFSVQSWHAEVGRQTAIRAALAAREIDAHPLSNPFAHWRHVAHCQRLQWRCVLRWKGAATFAALRTWAEQTASFKYRRHQLNRAVQRWTASPHPLLLVVLRCFDHWRALVETKRRINRKQGQMIQRAAVRTRGHVQAAWREEVAYRNWLRAVFGLVSQRAKRRVKQECLEAWKAAIRGVGVGAVPLMNQNGCQASEVRAAVCDLRFLIWRSMAEY
jgi:hypothetical protein